MSRLDEKRFKARGQEWIARFDFNATCAVEDDTGLSFYEVAAPFLAQIDKADVADPAKVLKALGGRYHSRVRLLLFHALSYEHEVSIEEVGELIGEIGLRQATEIVLWAIAKGLDADTSGSPDAEGNVPAAPVAPNRKARKAAAKRG